MLLLSETTPIAAGGRRYVYRHPDDPDLLVKIIQPKHRERMAARHGKSWKPVGRYRELTEFLREIHEHLAAVAAHGSTPPFLNEVAGVVDTDVGPGIVVRAVLGSDGELAPTLRQLIAAGTFGPREQRLFDAFIAALMASPVVVSDMRADNVVLADGTEPRFVLIDGLGDNTLLKLKSMFPGSTGSASGAGCAGC